MKIKVSFQTTNQEITSSYVILMTILVVLQMYLIIILKKMENTLVVKTRKAKRRECGEYGGRTEDLGRTECYRGTKPE
jgi:hypothetical protein